MLRANDNLFPIVLWKSSKNLARESSHAFLKMTQKIVYNNDIILMIVTREGEGKERGFPFMLLDVVKHKPFFMSCHRNYRPFSRMCATLG